jgi:hypothetical protein
MDTHKRNRLVESLLSKPEPQLVPIDIFLDGNDDLGSIGCNLMDHPGIEAFRSTFARIAKRPDVEAIYAQITELEPGENSWPFTDTVFVVGSIAANDLVHELSTLEPDEIGRAEDFGVPPDLLVNHASPVLAAWWD